MPITRKTFKTTAQQIFELLSSYPEKEFYVNELIRATGRYPNSVQNAVRKLFKTKIISTKKIGNKQFYKIITEKKSSEIESKPQFTGWKWVKLLNREASYAFQLAVAIANITNLKQRYGIDIPSFWYNSITGGVYYNPDELKILALEIERKINNDEQFVKRDIAGCYEAIDKLVSHSQKIPTYDLSNFTKRQLFNLLCCFYNNYLNVLPFLVSPHAIERYFEQRIRDQVADENSLEILLSPIYFRDEEMESAFQVAAYAKKYGFSRQYRKLLAKHCNNYTWLSMWSILSDPLAADYFDSEIHNIVKTVEDPQGEILRMKEEEKQRRNGLEKTLKEIKATKLFRNHVELLQQFMFFRTFRKNALCKAHYYHLPLLREIAVRMELTDKEVKHLSYEEMLSWLKSRQKEKPDIFQLNARSNISKRMEGWAILMLKGKITPLFEAKKIIEKMEQFQIVHQTKGKANVLKGRVASSGKTQGKVRIVRTLKDVEEVEKGDILVAKMTTPDYIIAMQKAAAIVTDEGGVTCHAAIVSREYGIPCIVGTKNATQVLNDGDTVEVDALEGVVRVIETLEIPEDIKIIPGRKIYEGKVRGRAKIILDASDFVKIEAGDILITTQTTPEYLSCLYRIKGFIVDEESITSHAVLYGRALRLTSIMGTKFSHNIIQDGENIELDATEGVVKRLDIR